MVEGSSDELGRGRRGPLSLGFPCQDAEPDSGDRELANFSVVTKAFLQNL